MSKDSTKRSMPTRKTTRHGAGAKPRQDGRVIVISGWIARPIKFLTSPTGKVLLGLALIGAVAGGTVFNHYYWKYKKIIDIRLASGAFNRTARILSAPKPVYVGSELAPLDVANGLRAAGYTQSKDNALGWYRMSATSIEIYPGDLSYFAREPAAIDFADGKVVGIRALNANRELDAYELEPELITNLFDDNRTKRRLFQFEDYPQHLVDAVIAVEDHRFYSHRGLDVIRTIGATVDGIREWRRPRGTSTLTQQLARNFFLTPESTYSRKAAEGDDRFPTGVPAQQGKDFRVLLESDFHGPQRQFQRETGWARRRAFTSTRTCATSLWSKRRCWPACRRGPSYLKSVPASRAGQASAQSGSGGPMLREDYIDRAGPRRRGAAGGYGPARAPGGARCAVLRGSGQQESAGALPFGGAHHAELLGLYDARPALAEHGRRGGARRDGGRGQAGRPDRGVSAGSRSRRGRRPLWWRSIPRRAK